LKIGLYHDSNQGASETVDTRQMRHKSAVFSGKSGVSRRENFLQVIDFK
jgi:hypothetical protein